MEDMRKTVLVILAVLIILGSLVVIIPDVSACHNLAVTCSSPQKDITDNNTWTVTYEIDVKYGKLIWFEDSRR